MDIGAWLRDLGLERYEQAFRDNDVDVDLVSDLTEADLEKLGVASLGHRKILLRAMETLRRPLPDPRDGANAVASEATPPPSASRSEAERRQLTVMFVDLVGSTELSARLDPEDMREVMGAYHRCVADAVSRFGGFVAKYLGDGVLVYFGYPQAHEEDAERAVQAGLALVDAVGQFQASERLQVRVGIATGLVVVGDLVDHGELRERAVVGETPNLAARLQGLAPPDAVVIAASTQRLTSGLFEYEDLGALEAKGFAKPVQAWRVLRESAVASRFEALHATAALTPLVGREEEIDLLLRRWERAKRGDGQVVLLTGEAGIGKSRITAALQERIAREPHVRLRYFCSPHHTDSPLHPVIAQLDWAAGFERGDTAETKLGKLEALLAPTMPPDEDVALLAELLSIPAAVTGRYPPRNLTPQRKKEKTFEALLRQLEGLARERPVLMLFEDVHWIDPSSHEVLSLTVDRVPSCPVLLLIAFRPEFQPPWTGQAHVTMLSLSRLDRRESTALAQRIAGDETLPPDVLDEIVERTDGVPLFVEELTKAVLEAGAAGASAVLTRTSSTPLAVPATLHASLMARLDRLGPHAREMAQIGAAIGRTFSYELVAAVAQRSDAALQVALGQLTASGLLFRRGTPPQSSYLFKHALVQDTAYSTLLRDGRREWHARIGQALERDFRHVAESQPEIMAHHFTEAGRPERAVSYWLKAGQLAGARSAHREAVSHLTKGLGLLETVAGGAERDQQELEFQIALGSALVATKGYAAAEAANAYARARELIRATNDASRQDAVFTGLFVVYYNQAAVKEALEVAEEFLGVADTHGEAAARCIGHRLITAVCNLMGDFPRAHRHGQQAIPLYDPDRHGPLASRFVHDIGVAALCQTAVPLWHVGYPEQSATMAERALALAARLNHANTRGYCWFYAGVLAALIRRDFVAVDEYTRKLIAYGREHRMPQWVAWGTCFQGPALTAAGRAEEAIERINDGIALCDELQNKVFRPAFFSFLADAYAAVGRIEEALANIAKGFDTAERTHERWIDVELWRQRGSIVLSAAAQRRAEEAERCFRRAVECARQHGARTLELRATTSLGRLWHEQGRRDEARDLLAPVYGWFTEGFDTADLKDAKALLDELR